MIDINLVPHPSNYNLRGQILHHINSANLSQIVNQFFTNKPPESDSYYIPEEILEKKNFAKKNINNINSLKSLFRKNCDFLLAIHYNMRYT